MPEDQTKTYQDLAEVDRARYHTAERKRGLDLVQEQIIDFENIGKMGLKLKILSILLVVLF